MPRKHDPIFAVMDFFESAPLVVATSTLSLVKRIMGRRQEAEAPPVVKQRRKRTPQQGVALTPLGMQSAPPPAPDVVPLGQPRRRAKRTGAEAGGKAARQEVDLQLPGIGPATIGE